jgi:hypothetical protein
MSRYPTTPVRLANGDLHNFTLRIEGKSYRCECRCNVFHTPDERRLDLYECNGCGTRFEAVSEGAAK